MLNRHYRIIEIGNKKRLLIDFDEKKYEILSIFLECEVYEFEEWIKEIFDKVLSGESEFEEMHGNVCGAEISCNTTKILDDLAKDGMGDWCEIDTKELRMLIDDWSENLRKFKLHYGKENCC